MYVQELTGGAAHEKKEDDYGDKMKQNMSKYQTVVGWVSENIENGTFQAGEKLLSENELSKKFQLSRQTIRHAIDILAQQKLVTKIQGSGTYIGQGRKGSPRRSYMNIAVISTYVDSYIFPSVLRGIERVLSDAGYATQIAFTGNQISVERNTLEKLNARADIDGLIVEPSKSALPSPNLHLYRDLMEQRIPILFFNTSHRDLELPLVSLDDVLVGRRAAEYLISKGHRKIGGIFKSDDGQGHLRYSGFIKTVLSHDIPIRERNVIWIDTEDMKKAGVLEDCLYYRLENCTAVLCYNDEVSCLLIGLCKKWGIRIPEDLSIISIDNSDLATASDVKLTSFAHPREALGRKAAKNMIRMIENPYFDGTFLFDSEVVERSSVYHLRSQDV